MKPKYYPHATVAAAAALTIAPLCFVLSLPYLRSTTQKSESSAVASLDSPSTPEAHTVASATVVHKPNSVTQKATTANAKTVNPSSGSKRAETRVALLSARNPTTAASHDLASSRPMPSVIPTETGVREIIELADGNGETSAVDETVPVPAIAAASSDSLPQLVAMQPATGNLSEVRKHSADSKPAQETASPNAKAESPNSNDIFIEPPTETSKSTFEATGHLAMTGGTTGAIAGTAKPVHNLTAPERVSDKEKKPERRPSRSRSRNSGRSARNSDEATAADMTVSGENPFAPGFGVTSPIQTEDVILQQPLENRHVARMENVIGVTRAKGWPIALVKSDLPDDFWWVQQMVGIRGNSFAARVNFGNEHSISGSVYHMVIVFLDSPDEVRRFRIAKQFKELPEGVRRSREFTFIRR